ncbi:MAG: ExeA family protein [Lachnospiraceae bacterium]|nr:ExeA family protein [Lachnospiraceae bacterium]
MYEAFYGMEHTPFGKDIPAERLYESRQVQDARGRLMYAADRKQFAVVTGDPGCGKSTLIRLLDTSIPKERYSLLYVSDSQLTPRWLYSGLLEQLGIKAHFYRGDAKRQLQKALKSLGEEQKKSAICVLDEAHLLEKETLEEFRFLLNSEFDSASPLSLVLVGQTELWEKLKLQRYTAITQRIDINIVLKPMDRSETGQYIRAHLAYAGGDGDIFTPGAETEIFKVSAGVPRIINRICEKSLMYSAQHKKKLIDEHVVRYVADHEMVGGGAV